MSKNVEKFIFVHTSYAGEKNMQPSECLFELLSPRSLPRPLSSANQSICHASAHYYNIYVVTLLYIVQSIFKFFFVENNCLSLKLLELMGKCFKFHLECPMFIWLTFFSSILVALFRGTPLGYREVNMMNMMM